MPKRYRFVRKSIKHIRTAGRKTAEFGRAAGREAQAIGDSIAQTQSLPRQKRMPKKKYIQKPVKIVKGKVIYKKVKVRRKRKKIPKVSRDTGLGEWF